MLRQILLLLNVFPLLFIINSTELKKEELKVELELPESAEIGSEFTVLLKITGGDVSGFAKYIDNLPRGLSAEPVEMGDATFTADNGQIKILWVNFPKGDELVLKYKVKVESDAPESADFGGKFSYLEGNEKKVYSVFKKQVKFGSADQFAAASKAKEPVPVSVNVVRRIINSRENVHQIELEINQTGLEGFGKIQEFVPLGAKVEQGEAQNAAYSQIKNKVKFVWMSLPKAGNFKVGYYIDLSEADNKDINSITGNFSYLDNDVTKKLDIEFEDSKPVLAEATSNRESSSVDNKSEDVINKDESKADENSDVQMESPSEEIALVPIPPVVQSEKSEENTEDQKTEVAENQNGDVTIQEDVEEEPVMANNVNNEVEQEDVELDDNTKEEEEVVAQVADDSDKEEPTSNELNKVDKTAAPSKAINNPQPPALVSAQTNNKGVRYRVQVAAGKNVVGPDYFQKKHNFSREFNVENHQGWVKYTTGSFSVYRDARNSREEINGAGHNFNGPFVTAYNEGIRITVQEALMITSQKWFK